MAFLEEVETQSSLKHSALIYGQCNYEVLDICAEFEPTSGALGCVFPDVRHWDDAAADALVHLNPMQSLKSERMLNCKPVERGQSGSKRVLRT